MEKKPLDDDRKEEIRGLFVLGLLAVFASIRVQYSSFMVQFGQLPLDIIPILNIIIIFWSLYAFFMVLGLSEDVIGKTAASAFRQNSKSFLLYNFVLLAVLLGFFGIIGFPKAVYLLALVFVLASYYIIAKLFEKREKTKKNKARKKKLTKKESLERLQGFSAIAILICSTVVFYVENEIVAYSVFVVGLVAIFLFAYFQEKKKDIKNKEQLLSYSD